MKWPFAVALFLLTFVVLFPGTGGEFLLLDDDDYVTENRFVRAGLTAEGITWAFTKTHSGHWHPLTWISLMIDTEFFGISSDASRIVNLVVHGVSIALLFFPLSHLMRSAWGAFVACGIFGIHPLRLESVLWVSERKDVLSVFFLALVLLFYEQSIRKHERWAVWLAVTAASCGMLSKPSLVTLPLLLLTIDYCYSDKPLSFAQVSKWLLQKWAYWVVSIGASVAAVIGQAHAGGLKTEGQLPLIERCANVGIGYVIYLGKLFWPYNLSVFYPLQTPQSGIGAGCWILLAGLTLIVVTRVTCKLLVASWFWFLISLLPVIGLVQVGWQQVADRWTYIPHLLPIAAIIAWCTQALHGSRWVAGILALGVLGILSVESHVTAPRWLHSKELFTHALQMTSGNFFIAANLGVAYDQSGDTLKAMELYREALRIHPEYPIALNNIGVLLAREGKFAESLVYFNRALARHPDFVSARYHLGLALFRMEQIGPALVAWSAVLEVDPSHIPTREIVPVAVKEAIRLGCVASGLTSPAAKTLFEGGSRVTGELFREIVALRCFS